MKIKKIILKNIRSYENQEIVFPEGSLLLSGDIGSGKTTVLLAIEYALFGLQPGQKGSALLKNNAEEGGVSLEIEIDDKSFIIERRLRRGNKSVSNEYAALVSNGEKSELSITELKTKILEILGYPQEFIKKNNLLFRYTVFTPQEQMKQIVLEDPEIRLNIIRHIFGIDKYKRIRENLFLVLANLKERSKVLQGEIKNLDDDKFLLLSRKNFIIHLNKKIEEIDSTLVECIKKRKFIENELKQLEQKIKEKEKFEKEVEKTNILLSTKRETLSNKKNELQELSSIISDFKEAFNEEEYNLIIEGISTKKETVDKLNVICIEKLGLINSLEQRKNESFTKTERIFQIDICPTCLQDVPESHKYNIKNEAERDSTDISKKLIELNKEISSINERLGKERAERRELDERKVKLEIIKSRSDVISQTKNKIFLIEKQKENMDKDILLLSQHLESLKGDILTFSKFNNIIKSKQEEFKQSLIEERKADILKAEERIRNIEFRAITARI